MADRPRGRPKGSHQSEDAKAKISRARRARATGAPTMPTAPVGMPYEMMREIVSRDRDSCRACHETRYRWVEIREGGVKKKVRRMVPGFAIHKLGMHPVDPGNDEMHALFCDFCGSNIASQFKSIDDLPPRRGG